LKRVNEKALFKVALAVVDTALVAGGFMLAYWLRFHLPVFPPPPKADLGTYVRFSAFIGFAGFVTLYTSGMYRLQQPFFGIDDFFAVVKSGTLSHLIAAAVSFAIRGRIPGDEIETYSRIVIAMSWLLCIVLLTFWRLGFDLVLTVFRRRGVGLTRVLIVGEDDFGRSFHDLLKHNPELGYEPVGLVGEDGEDRLREILRTCTVDEVMVTAGDVQPNRVMALLGACQEASVRFSMVPSLFHMLTSQIQIREVAGVPIFALDERIFLRSSRILKRGIDLALAGSALLLTSPFLVIVSVLIKLESRGPILWKQVRVGRRARPFTIYKFRSMRADAEALQEELSALNEAQGPLFKIRRDPRVTRVGRVIRKLSVDEVPQLLNVLRGDMSLVGPRPPLPDEVDQYEPWQRKRFEVFPGITGLAQISGRSDLTFDETLRYDFYYIENWSPLIDIKIILKTIPKVLLARGAY
jgi:exopolysaccharide biosynthesis polyprenyl glycosylphosphotransferase